MKKKTEDGTRIYVCHTLYHIYISVLKELNLPKEKQGRADIALSTVFMDLSSVSEGLKESGIFREVLIMEERRAEDFPEIVKYRKNCGNILIHLFNRLKYTKKLGKKQCEFIKIDFRRYEDIYVFCDSDPIGYYLNYMHIPYHAVEDGYNCLKVFDAAHVDNKGHFELKAKLSKLGLIFIQNGYSRYCIDMEINDDSFFDYKFDGYVVVPRKKLEENIRKEDKIRILRIFVPDADELSGKLKGLSDCTLFLTEGYPGDRPDIRIKVADEIMEKYIGGENVVIKPHPRDDVDYTSIYPKAVVIRGKFPIEVLNFLDGIHFKKAVSIITSALDNISFADEKINIGPGIYDNYEPREKHAFMFGDKK